MSLLVGHYYVDYDTLFERPTSISCNFENILSNRVQKYHVTGDSVIVNNIDRPKLNLTGDMREFIPQNVVAQILYSCSNVVIRAAETDSHVGGKLKKRAGARQNWGVSTSLIGLGNINMALTLNPLVVRKAEGTEVYNTIQWWGCAPQ